MTPQKAAKIATDNKKDAKEILELATLIDHEDLKEIEPNHIINGQSKYSFPTSNFPSTRTRIS